MLGLGVGPTHHPFKVSSAVMTTACWACNELDSSGAECHQPLRELSATGTSIPSSPSSQCFDRFMPKPASSSILDLPDSTLLPIVRFYSPLSTHCSFRAYSCSVSRSCLSSYCSYLTLTFSNSCGIAVPTPGIVITDSSTPRIILLAVSSART